MPKQRDRHNPTEKRVAGRNFCYDKYPSPSNAMLREMIRHKPQMQEVLRTKICNCSVCGRIPDFFCDEEDYVFYCLHGQEQNGKPVQFYSRADSLEKAKYNWVMLCGGPMEYNVYYVSVKSNRA